MLDKQDIALLQDMMDTTVSKSLKVTLKVALEENNRVFKQELRKEWRNDFRDILSQNNADLKREIRDEMHSLISSSEYRTTARIDNLSMKVDGLKSEIVSEVCGVISDAILPQIHELQVDMRLVKNHLKLA